MIRSEEEEKLFNQFDYSYVGIEREPIFKGFNKVCYSEPRERRSESVDYEWGAQSINPQSNVVMPRPAADTKVSNKNAYDRQRRDDESTIISVDGNICLTWETSPKILSDEEYHGNEFREVIVENSVQVSNVKVLNQQESDLEDWKCDKQAFENNSSVSVRRPAAETEVSNKNTNGRQRPDTECTLDSVCLKTCLKSEIDLLDPIGASSNAFIASSESSFTINPSIHYWNRSLNRKSYQRH
jgi:hypothetical protein